MPFYPKPNFLLLREGNTTLIKTHLTCFQKRTRIQLNYFLLSMPCNFIWPNLQWNSNPYSPAMFIALVWCGAWLKYLRPPNLWSSRAQKIVERGEWFPCSAMINKFDILIKSQCHLQGSYQGCACRWSPTNQSPHLCVHVTHLCTEVLR